jgi:hypothetical protein
MKLRGMFYSFWLYGKAVLWPTLGAFHGRTRGLDAAIMEWHSKSVKQALLHLCIGICDAATGASSGFSIRATDRPD